MARFDEILSNKVLVDFHEILGHGSGRFVEGLTTDYYKQTVGKYAASLEELRAEVAALYHILDIKALLEFNILPSTMGEAEVLDFAELSIIEFFTRHLRSYVKRLDANTKEIRQSHQWARQVMLNYLLEQGPRLIISPNGIPMVEIVDLALLHTKLGDLWNIVQRARSQCSFEIAESIYVKYGDYTKEQKAFRAAMEPVETKLNPPMTIYLILE